MRFDLVIKGGQTIDDAAGLTGRNDVAIVKDRIVAVEPGIPADSAFRAIDADGLYVTPGLIDLHAHIYRGATFWGIDADASGSRGRDTVPVGSVGWKYPDHDSITLNSARWWSPRIIAP